MVLDDENEYPDKEDEGYLRLHELYVELKKSDKEVNGYKYRKYYF